MPSTLTLTRHDGITASFPLVWVDHAVSVDGEWTTTPAPALLPEDDEALTDFAGYDVLETIAYLWIDGNGITSADVEGGNYTITL